MTNNEIVQKLWNLCDVLRDDGINYNDYLTELVMLLFIKMVHEKEQLFIEEKTEFKPLLPEGCRWEDLSGKSGINLLDNYRRMLLVLSTGKENDENVHNNLLLLAIYANAKTALTQPKHLEQLVRNFDEMDWFSAQKDGLGDLYEGLLEKNAAETKSVAGQDFTPRALINLMVRCINPVVGEVIQDPAAGTAGFLIAADQYMRNKTDDYFDLSEQDRHFQIHEAFKGVELVTNTRRLALMNCLLHGIEGGSEGAVIQGNSLGDVGKNLKPADIILANPPFGTSKGGDAAITRDDLTFETTNKQLAFLQHIYRNLKEGGRAAVVLPDNVLFEAGKGTDIRKDLMDKCHLHTILRLPTGIFYAQGVKTNVLFFDKVSNDAENSTQKTWVYDLRTNMPSFGKRTPFTEKYLEAFEKVFNPTELDVNKANIMTILSARREGEWSYTEGEQTAENSRWKCFDRTYIRDVKGDSLDISWLKDNAAVSSEDLPEPEELIAEAKAELEAALAGLDELFAELTTK
ncbi:type I restriction-modification system subunit M [Glaesserella parasuis]|nr:type I restriction-modification system subunit M [Glaesserella parasuis]